jgi:hypothetical protein
LLVKALVMLASIDGGRSCCGRTADEHGGLPVRRYSGIEQDDGDCLWVVRDSDDGHTIPVAFMQRQRNEPR